MMFDSYKLWVCDSYKLWVCFTMVFITHSAKVTCANTDYMNSTIRNYFADTRHHDVNSTYKTRAKEFIFNEFRRYGLAAEYQDFKHNDGNTYTNVIGVLKGANFGKTNDRIVGLLAHYDTVTTTKGVDDNGAGVAAILEVARQLHEQNVKTEHTVLFVSPDLEESGLVGSRQFVNSWLPVWTQLHYRDTSALLAISQGCIVLDTMMEYNTSDYSQIVPKEAASLFQQFFPTTLNSIQSDGYEGDFLALIYRHTPDSELAHSFQQSWNAEGQEEYQIEPFALPFSEIPSSGVAAGFGNFLRSDHYNFWEANIPAVFITDTANFRGDMIDCYHSSCDNVDVMLTEDNLRFLGKTADALARTIHSIAGNGKTSGNGRNNSNSIMTVVSAIIVFLLIV